MIAITIAIYVFIIFSIWFAVKSESLDMFCPKGCKTYDTSKCKDGQGKYYVDGRGVKNDRVSELLNKVEHLSEIDKKTVIWRKSFLSAVFITILISVLVLNHVPSGQEILLMIVLSFIVCYFSHMFYYQHYYRFVSDFTKENIDFIRNKLKLQKQRKVVI